MNKKLFSIVILTLFLVPCMVGLSAAGDAADFASKVRVPDLKGVWVGTAQGAMEGGFFEPTDMTLTVTDQSGLAFYGTIAFGSSPAFDVTGVWTGGVVRITGSASLFEGVLTSSHHKAMRIAGTGSKFETAEGLQSALTVTFNLIKQPPAAE